MSNKKETYVKPHKRKNPKSSGEHHVSGHNRKLHRKKGGGRISKYDKLEDSYKSREELIEQDMELEDMTREEAEEYVDSYIDDIHPDKDLMSYETEEGDILNFQSAFYPMRGKWMISDIRDNPRGTGKAVELKKLTKTGKVDKRTNSKLYPLSDIEHSVATTEENKSKEHTSPSNQRVEFVGKGDE